MLISWEEAQPRGTPGEEGSCGEAAGAKPSPEESIKCGGGVVIDFKIECPVLLGAYLKSWREPALYRRLWQEKSHCLQEFKVEAQVYAS